MQVKLLALIVTSFALSLLCSGCATSGSRVIEVPSLTVPRTSDTTRLTVTTTYGACVFRYDLDSQYYLITGSLQLISGGAQCEDDDEDTQIVVQHKKKNQLKKVTSKLIPQRILTEGSCRWCYTNSSGGLTCVTYNPPPGGS